jgi:uncharacterized protein (DUF924 family)
MADVVTDFETVLDFWFGKLNELGIADEAHSMTWFQKDVAFDARLRSQFLELHAELLGGAHESWLEAPRSRLAVILVLDQFSRNMFRDTPRMFAGDEKALALANSGIDRGMDRLLGLDERAFFYMPLMHSEVLADQERSVEVFGVWAAEQTGALRERGLASLDFARRHLVIIQRFGRFPHRNQILGRESTPEELEFLKQPGSSF